MLTQDQLTRIMPHLGATKAATFLPHMNRALRESGIDNLLRTAAFLAQIAHESSELRLMRELWGPTDSQRRYEPQSTLATRLGNTQPGDGARFKGRGPIQITGRANYARYGELLDVELVAEPELAAAPEVGFRIAGLFWSSNSLNEKADAQDFVSITKRINGGTNGLAERERYYELAKHVLAADFVPNPPSRGAPSFRRPAEPLDRGFEAIAQFGP